MSSPDTALRRRWRPSPGWKGAAFTVPFFLGYALVFVAPFVYALVQSVFSEQRSGLGFGPSRLDFVGLANFARATTDTAFWGGLLRVVLFACVQIPVMLGMSLVMALLLDAVTRRMTTFFRTALLIPYIVPGIVATLIWVNLYSPLVGPLTRIGEAFGLQWQFFSPGMVLPSIGNLLTWHGIGYNMLILYAALQAVPRELFEAARIDGASEMRVALSIKIPYVRGALVLTGMLSIIFMTQIFNEPVLFRQVSPETVTQDFTPVLAIYNQAFGSGNYHYAAALSVLLTVTLAAVSALFYRLTGRERP